ncbi:GntR family transcriptional regulator [Nocardioides sp.]|uniref:GntR family transcriptional regulator n=1 Tax=Nocardioides sp. TaxID=35761 RepID=UPI002C1529BE|nr:GntR family transcriptional regulator [Nocardioides sp.]HXH81082.1 GntR family transcriptional regulator [Nocardioides sp.]
MPIPLDEPRIDRSLLRDGVYVRLRDAIVEGSLTPGEQLRDLEIADWLGVSRTPVREALLRLGETGLVIARPGRSTVVSQIDVRAVREARDVVAAMHELAVRAAVATLTTRDLDRMRAANDRFRQALAAGDVTAALSADDELHGIPVSVADNTAIAAVLAQFTPVVRRAELLRFATTGGDSAVLHDQLITHCQDGDTDAAAQVAFDTWHSLETD